VTSAYLFALASVVAALFLVRLVVGQIPLRAAAVHMSPLDSMMLAAGLIGLALHCGAMFFRSQLRGWPEGQSVIHTVDPLDTASILWFALAAALVMVALRQLHPTALTVVAFGLALVGYTMYDGGRLHTHLVAIFSAVVVLAAVVALLVIPPWQGTSGAAPPDHGEVPRVI
jgi:hypothetical protein